MKYKISRNRTGLRAVPGLSGEQVVIAPARRLRGFGLRRLGLMGAALAALAGAAWAGYGWWVTGRHIETTDDAYVGANVTAIAPHVSGFVSEMLAADTGEAEFGAIRATEGSPAAFVISLGVCGYQSAILFTRRSGTPLGVGRYRISEPADRADEILALVLTGSVTRPTGVFRGLSGWLVITAASDRLVTGRFQLDAIGWLASEPQGRDRHVSVSGSFSATAGTSSRRTACLPA